MGTRSRIGLQLNGGIVSVYCHWDGYPEYNGVILEHLFKDKDSISELIDGGDISSLLTRSDWDNKEFEDNPRPLYYSERGEDCPPQLDYSITEFYERCNNCCAEYGYIFDNGNWTCYDVDTDVGKIYDIPDKTEEEFVRDYLTPEPVK
tara:strand:- start:336 stop:779 length:444 start_codon:yes stop_codon:yes gene_type:complete